MSETLKLNREKQFLRIHLRYDIYIYIYQQCIFIYHVDYLVDIEVS